MSAFRDAVYEVVRQIPRGQVATYGQVSRVVGRPRSARFVGYALHANPEPGIIPCHRVVFADGSLAPAFAFGGEDEQRRLLEGEGVTFLADGRVDMASCQWEVTWPLDLALPSNAPASQKPARPEDPAPGSLANGRAIQPPKP